MFFCVDIYNQRLAVTKIGMEWLLLNVKKINVISFMLYYFTLIVPK